MRKLILTLGATALLAAPATASAADYTVTGGRLDWTMANQFDGTTRHRPHVARLRDHTVGGGAAERVVSPDRARRR